MAIFYLLGYVGNCSSYYQTDVSFDWICILPSSFHGLAKHSADIAHRIVAYAFPFLPRHNIRKQWTLNHVDLVQKYARGGN
jgi:hypothetical protein